MEIYAVPVDNSAIVGRFDFFRSTLISQPGTEILAPPLFEIAVIFRSGGGSLEFCLVCRLGNKSVKDPRASISVP